jgi:hypothetical protein
LALSVGLVACLAIWYSNVRVSYRLLSGVALVTVSLALYIRTLAPTILPADSGEFQFVSHVLGIAHPPGYPLYTMLAKLFTYLPVGDIAYRVNLFSALSSALTLLVLYHIVQRVTGSLLAGWIAAAALGVAPTFWAQSTTANIRSLTALITALQLGFLIGYAHSKNPQYLSLFSVALGLGITHHGSLIPLALPYVVYLLLSDPELAHRPRSWLQPLAVFALSLSVLLYLPVRSWMGAPFDPQPIRSLASLLEHVLALGFRGDMFYFVQPMVLLSRLRVFWNILAFQFGSLWLLLVACGVVGLLLRRGRMLLLLGGVLIINALLAITYRAPQTVEYMMPTYVTLALVGAYGAWSLGAWVLSHWKGAEALAAVFLATALVVPAVRLLRNYPSFVQLSRDRSARQDAETILLQAPPGARILSNWHSVTPLWYLQQVERVRPDVEVVYVYPEGAEPIADTWVRRVQESVVSARPTIVTNQYPGFAVLPYTFRPFANAWLVQPSPVYQVPASIQRLDEVFDERIEFSGFELDSDTLSPSSSLVLQLYWRSTIKLERDYSFFVHLVDESGVPLGQGDVTHPAARYEVGEVILDQYRLPLLPTVRPGRYRLLAGVYITLAEGGWQRLTTGDGRDSVVLGQVEVQPLGEPPVTRHEMHRTSGSGYSLVGADYDQSLPGQVRLYLHWRADAPASHQQRAMVFSQNAVLAATDLPVVPSGKYVTTAHDLPADVGDLILEVQSVVDGMPALWSGPWNLALSRRLQLPAPSPLDRYVCLGGEMVLMRAEYPPASSGGTLLTRMTFVATRALTHDYTVSVSLAGEADSWRTQHDGTPALGAIPTLKWIRGLTVQDERSLPLPADAMGRGMLHLTVYDAFTVQPLPVLDERLARLGQGTQIELGSVEVR